MTLDKHELKAFLLDRFAQCIREHGHRGDKDYDYAQPYVDDCLRYFEPFLTLQGEIRNEEDNT